MADGKLYITISDKRFGKNVAEADEQNKLDKQKESDGKGIESFLQHRFFNMIEGQAKQAVMYSINNIGNFTGDYVTQQHVSDAVEVANFLVDLGVSAVAGAKMTGSWVGAVVAVGMSLVNKGVSYAESIYAGGVQTRRTNKDIALLRSRAGLNSTNNGGRGTEY